MPVEQQARDGEKTNRSDKQTVNPASYIYIYIYNITVCACVYININDNTAWGINARQTSTGKAERYIWVSFRV